jgi:serine/threonine protein kinase/tetratricopeptide (TPR) repeat protein
MTLIQRDEEAIFHAARKIEGHEARGGYLDRACGPDRALRERLDALLRVHDEERSFLEAPAVDSPTLAIADWNPQLPEGPGSVIGPYKLLEPIGEGGMGVVYMAEQTEPVRRKVALKVIKPGMDTRQVVARFEAERQALALMDHPNIARVLDAGATDTGRPYFVMELVRGIPITDYCDGAELSVPARLDLFVQVCQAVQHAHQKGVIHRDLKPTNILVTLHDGVPVPKVIDFGVAKAVGQQLTERTLFTGFAQLIGTPLYMSPEQAELSGLDIDTRSDIYSLGVLLYELLTGTTPFDPETLRKAAFDEVRRIIREEEPKKPSTRLSTLGETLPEVSAKRGTEPRRLNKVVRGELDWIVMKALEKDRKRRYETASGLAADVRRYLDDEPVQACPPSAWYRLSKAARRHRVALVTSALVATALVRGTAVSTWQAVRATRAEAQAAPHAEETQLVVDYLVQDVFGAARPERSRGRALTVHDLLRQGEVLILARFGRRPLVEAAARSALGETYQALGRQEDAVLQFRRIVDLRTRHLGPDHSETLVAEAALVDALCPAGVALRSEPAEAEPIARRVLEARRRQFGPADPRSLASMAALAYVLLIKATQVLIAENAHTLEGLPAGTLRSRVADSTSEARDLLERACAGQARQLGPDHPEALETLETLGCVLLMAGEITKAESTLRHSAEVRLRVLGPEHPATLRIRKYLGGTLQRMGSTGEATRLLSSVAEATRRTFGLFHIQTSSAFGALLEVLKQSGDTAAIRDLCERSLREIRELPIDQDPYQRSRRAIMLNHLGLRLTILPEPIPYNVALAVQVAEEAVAIDDNSYNWTILGAVYWRVGRPDDADRALRIATERPDWNGGRGFYWVVQSLLHARRGELVTARECYERSLADNRESWTDLLRALRAEAAALLDPAELPYDVFAPPGMAR